MTIWNPQGTYEQNLLVQDALARCDFPFERLAPSLQREGKSAIRVEWADLSRYNERAARAHEEEHSHVKDGDAVAHPIERVIDGRRAVLGLFYLPPYTKVVLSNVLTSRPPLAHEVFLAEAAHAVDYHYMTSEHRRAIVNLLHHDQLSSTHPVDDGVAFHLDAHVCSWFDVGAYRDWVGEAFMEAFIEAFAHQVKVTIALGHPTGLEQAAAIRDLLLGVEPEPDPAKRVFAWPLSIAYHDSHRFPLMERLGVNKQWYDSAEKAQAAGLRACRTCKPDRED